MNLSVPDEQRFWSRLTVVVGALAIIKGLRLPNLWSATQLQFGYQFGFIKRGAAGAVLHAMRVPIQHYWVCAAVSILILFLSIAAVSAFIRRYAITPDARTWTPVFASSFAVTYLTHLVGYLDLILLTMTSLTLVIPWTTVRPVSSYVICACAVLVHEEFALMFFPLIWFYWVLKALRFRDRRSSVALAQVIGLPIVVCCLSVVVALGRPMSVAQVSAAERAIATAADFPVRADFFEVMQRSLLDNMHSMVGRFRGPSWWFDEVSASLALLWVAAFFAWRSNLLIRAAGVRHASLLKTLALCVSFAPALMQLIGWDIYRWYAITAFSSFGAYMLLVRTFADTSRVESDHRARTIVILLIALNLCTGAGLFDGYTVNTFPFIDPIKALIKATAESGHVPIPER